MLQTLLELEGNILLWLQENLRNDFLSILFQIITHFGTGGIFWIALTVALLVNKKTRWVGSMCTVSIVLTFLVNNLILKNLVARTRPYFVIEGLATVGMRPSDFSFPSGHTAISFCVAGVLFRNLPKKWGSLFLILAVLIAFSRLYLGMHYPSDVLAGALIGTFFSFVAEKIINYYIHSHKKQANPCEAGRRARKRGFASIFKSEASDCEAARKEDAHEI